MSAELQAVDKNEESEPEQQLLFDDELVQLSDKLARKLRQQKKVGAEISEMKDEILQAMIELKVTEQKVDVSAEEVLFFERGESLKVTKTQRKKLAQAS